MTQREVVTTVNFDRLRQELGWALDELELELGRDRAVERVATDAGTTARTLRRILTPGQSCAVETAERLLDAIGYRDGPRRNPVGPGYFLPLVIRSRYLVDGRRRQPGETGRIKKVDFANALLSESQLRAIHRLHVDGGLSLREICRRGWQAWGYSSPKSALTSVSERLRAAGLQPRSQALATAKANRERPGVVKPAELTQREWRRRQRAQLRATDPVFRAGELERIAMLRERERAAS